MPLAQDIYPKITLEGKHPQGRVDPECVWLTTSNPSDKEGLGISSQIEAGHIAINTQDWYGDVALARQLSPRSSVEERQLQVIKSSQIKTNNGTLSVSFRFHEELVVPIVENALEEAELKVYIN